MVKTLILHLINIDDTKILKEKAHNLCLIMSLKVNVKIPLFLRKHKW